MQQLINITQQWQIYLPEEIRKKMDLTKPTRARISVDADKIIVEPLKSQVLSLAGKFRGRKPIKLIELDKERDEIDYSDL